MNYRIKPLEWIDETSEIKATDLVEQHTVSAPMCSFEIEKMESGHWYYSFCFDEYYDDGMGECKDLKDGKVICEKIWEDRLKKCLIKED